VAIAAFGDDSPLVKASKQSMRKGKKSASKVITNADLKRSKGKLITLQSSTMADIPPAPAKSRLELQAEERQQHAAADLRRTAAEKKVSELEQELARIEQSYYEENDPVIRDTKIAKKFAETKGKLEAAKRDLPTTHDPQPTTP
jgi:hypothetical protein